MTAQCSWRSMNKSIIIFSNLRSFIRWDVFWSNIMSVMINKPHKPHKLEAIFKTLLIHIPSSIIHIMNTNYFLRSWKMWPPNLFLASRSHWVLNRGCIVDGSLIISLFKKSIVWADVWELALSCWKWSVLGFHFPLFFQ